MPGSETAGSDQFWRSSAHAWQLDSHPPPPPGTGGRPLYTASSYGDAVPGGYNGTVFAYHKDRPEPVGYLDWLTADGTPGMKIGMIEVHPDFGHRDVATHLLMQAIRRAGHGGPVDPGTLTPDGSAWWARSGRYVAKHYRPAWSPGELTFGQEQEQPGPGPADAKPAKPPAGRGAPGSRAGHAEQGQPVTMLPREGAEALQDLLHGPGEDGPDLDDGLAYDRSDGPPRRPLSPADRRLLHRVIGLVARDPRWQLEEVARRPEIGVVIGDGARPQTRDLSARERDGICRMVQLLTGETSFQDRHGTAPAAYLAGLDGGDIARLNLIARVISPLPDAAGRRIVVHMADWAPPADIPPGWDIACAPRPISGPLTWQDEDRGHGRYYAACPPGQDGQELGWGGDGPAAGQAWPVYVADNPQVAQSVAAFLARYRCGSPEEAGTTMAQAARDLGLPWLDDPAALGDDHSLWHFTAAQPDTGAQVWHAVHGGRRRDFVIATMRAAGFEITGGQEPDLAAASNGARRFYTYVLSHGWDAAYQPFCRAGQPRPDLADRVGAVNPDTGEVIDRKWAAGKAVAAADGPLARSREKIRSCPRLLKGPAGIAALDFPSASQASGPGRTAASGPGAAAAGRARRSPARQPAPETGTAKLPRRARLPGSRAGSLLNVLITGVAPRAGNLLASG